MVVESCLRLARKCVGETLYAGKATRVDLVAETSAPTPRQLFALRGGKEILATPTTLAGSEDTRAAEVRANGLRV